MLKVLSRRVPDRPVLFEIGFNGRLTERFADPDAPSRWKEPADNPCLLSAWRNLGFDYATVRGSQFGFPKGEREKAKTVSLNEGALITDRASFDAYKWPDPDDFDYSGLDRVELPDGMQLICWGPGGVLENAIGLVGYEQLCYMLVDDPGLAQDVFDNVGSRLTRYYEICAQYESVGALMGNDDWGFKTQTMLPPHKMRELVVPWHASIVAAIHAAGKPAILHSCGQLDEVMDDVVDTIGYDAKHSYEDAITPVEEVYERWGDRIAILGGIDVDFLCRSSPDAIRRRSADMLERAAGRGGYALGSGNSVPDYVPDESFLAMASVAVGEDL
jgi:uroporphyrinogen decarboxylase